MRCTKPAAILAKPLTRPAENAKISAMSKKKKKQPTSKPAANTKSAKAAEQTSADATTASAPVQPQPTNFSSAIFAQYFSFVLLLIVIVLVSVLFYEVMAAFWIPLFLAAVLVVVFRPWYDWLRSRFKLGDAVAALLTTASVLLIVLIPLGAILVFAAAESQQVLRQFNSAKAVQNAKQVRTKLGLELPMAVTQNQVEIENLSSTCTLDVTTANRHQAILFEIEQSTDEIADFWELKRPANATLLDQAQSTEDASIAPNTPDGSDETDTNATTELPALNDHQNTSIAWQTYLTKLAATHQLRDSIDWTNELPSTANSDDTDKSPAEIRQQRLASFHDYKLLLSELEVEFDNFKTQQLGGKTKAWAATLLNPTEEQSEAYIAKVTNQLRDTLFVFGGKGLTYILFIVGGSIVMIVSFYFFLLDGRSMINAFKRLSPLDDEHEQELVDQFSRVSRAVVVATLLSALVQGLLAGVGFYFASLDSIFLLTVLSAVLAMVPFLGAASVWIPCALYLYFIDNNMTAAIGLAIYGAAVISMADNIIKPLVLHGQSKLHPLFAFLSVIGGLAMLGPIGILIGPMIVAFLQTLLEILHTEVSELKKSSPVVDDNATL